MVDGKASIQGIVIAVPDVDLSAVLPAGKNGAVFEGWDNLGRHVAVKIWFRSGRSPQRMARQAREEASKLARISHRYIGKVYAAQQLEDGKFCMVMEFIEGETLREHLAKGPDLFTRYRIWGQVSDAVYRAHQVDVFHGDVHDRNVLVTGEEVRLIDFGTSIFRRNKADSRQREAWMLLKLARQLIPEENPAAVWAQPFDRLDPRVCLAALNAWVELVYLISTPRHDINDDYMEVRALAFKVGIVLGEHPYFSVKNVLRWLEEKPIPPLVVPLLQHLHASYLASLDGKEEHFTAPVLTDPLEDQLRNVEHLRERTAALYTSGERVPSDYLAEWQSFS